LKCGDTDQDIARKSGATAIEDQRFAEHDFVDPNFQRLLIAGTDREALLRENKILIEGIAA
jgi:hypothetical protein